MPKSNWKLASQRRHYCLQVSEESVFSEPSASLPSVGPPATATADEMAALRYVAGAVGDDWQVLARCLHVKATGVHSARRRAQQHGFDDVQTRLEVLSSWFRAQPRATNKVDDVVVYTYVN